MKGLSKGRYDETFAGEDGLAHTMHYLGLFARKHAKAQTSLTC